MSATAPVVYGGIRQLAIGYDNHGVLDGAQAGRTNADVFDSALHRVSCDPVAAPERPVGYEDSRPKDIGQCLLGGEGHSDAADAEPGDDAVRWQRECLGDVESGDGYQYESGSAYSQRHYDVVQGAWRAP